MKLLDFSFVIKFKSELAASTCVIHLPLCSVKIFDPNVLESLLRGLALADLVVKDAAGALRSLVC